MNHSFQRGDIIVSGASRAVVWSHGDDLVCVPMSSQGQPKWANGLVRISPASAIKVGMLTPQQKAMMIRTQKAVMAQRHKPHDVAWSNARREDRQTIQPQGKAFWNSETGFAPGCTWVQKKGT